MVPEDVGAPIAPSPAGGVRQPAAPARERPGRALREQPGPGGGRSLRDRRVRAGLWSSVRCVPTAFFVPRRGAPDGTRDLANSQVHF